MEPPDIPPGILLSEPEFEIRSAALDHGIPSLAFAFRQREPVNVWRSALDDLDLPVGPWIDTAKEALRGGLPDRHRIAVPGAGDVPLGLLRARVFRSGDGQHFAYVTDAADSEANRASIIELARGADELFIEAPFLERDRVIADERFHLTAGAAGLIAREAGVRRITPFHFSPRYGDETSALAEEVRAAFEGERG